MLQEFSNSTFIEGYGANGTLTYGLYGTNNDFISHVHAWSTGSVSGLLNYLVVIKASPLDVPVKDGQLSFSERSWD